MYYAISKLDADKFSNLDFTLNFGITPDVKNLFVDWLANGGTFEETRDVVFKATDTLMLLKLHRYFDWADKKLHTVFFIENKDHIDDDLLSDFKEGTKMEVKPGLLRKKTAEEKKDEQNPAGMKQADIFSYSEGKQAFDVVDMHSEADFPSLGGPPPKQQQQQK